MHLSFGSDGKRLGTDFSHDRGGNAAEGATHHRQGGRAMKEPTKAVPVNAAPLDDRVHLAPPGLSGKMLDGRLETLCGLSWCARSTACRRSRRSSLFNR